MTGYIRNDTTNNIANGNVINANDLDGEFDAIQSAFDASTGHTHDGTVGSGAPIEVLGPAQDVVVTATVIRPKTDNAVDLGTSSLEFKNLYLDGTAQVDTLQVDESATITANLTVNGNTTLGNAATDTVTVTADVASSLIPATDNTYDLGTPTDEWRDLYIDGTANIDSLVADTADINGGTIDGAVIGGSSAAAGTFTTATATTGNITTVNATTVDTTNIEVTNIKAKDGTASATIADTTGVMTIASAVLTTADINGGTIDGTTIGGSSAAAGTFTTATATTGNITTVNATTVDTTNIEVTNIKAKDGTAAGSIADSTGVVTLASSVLTTTDINGGTIDGTVIGGTSAAAGTFTTVTASGDLTIADKIVHSGDTNTSIRFPAADTVTVETSGTERVRVDSTGNVGIGVTAPTSKLNVVGDQIVVSGTSGTAGLGLQLKGTPIDAIPAAQTQGYIATGNSGIGTAGDLLIAPRTDTTASIRFVVGTTPTERMRVDASGNVYFGNGVNVASPANSFLLATNGSGTDIAGASMTIQAGRGTGAGAGGALAFNTAAAGTTGTTLNAATERMRINTAGNVGIGTSSPAYKLVVSAAGASGIEFGPAYSGTANLIQHYSRSGGVYVDAVNDAAQHRFATSGTERMRIDSSGNVGIATTSPAGLLEVFDVLTVPARNTLTVANKRGLSIYNNQSAGAVDTTLAYGNTVNSYLAFGHHNGTTYAERMRIDAVGNVGIGIAAPIEKLDVRGAIFVGNVASGINYDGMILDYNTSTREARLAVGATSGGSSFFTFTTSNAGTEAERMRINAVGNVGIGTSSPAQRLHVKGVSGSPAIQVETSNGTNNSTQPVLTVGTDTLTYQAQIALVREGTSGLLGWSFLTNAVGSPTERMRIDSAGNVGIGTNAPAQRLHVVGQARIVGSVSSGRLDIFGATSATDGAFSLNSTATRSFVIRDEYSAAERMRIDSSGNVVIGNGDTSATPTNGILQATGGSGTDIVGATLAIQGGRGTGSAAGGPIIFSTAAAGTTGTTLNAATERMRLSAGGILTVGTTNGVPGSSNVVGAAISGLGYISISRDNISAEFNRIASDGDAVVFYRAGTKVGSISVTTTATAYNTSSDYRLKESIQPIFGASDRVRQLNPVNFAWKADGTRTDGFIAHEVQAVAPQAVTGEKDGEEMQAIDHSKLVPLLTAALQEALTEIADLKARITALEA